MKKTNIKILFLAVALTLIPIWAMAQPMPDSIRIEFDFDGFGNMILSSPPLYSGAIYDGDPLVVVATWTVTMDDSEWSLPDDPNAR